MVPLSKSLFFSLPPFSLPKKICAPPSQGKDKEYFNTIFLFVNVDKGGGYLCGAGFEVDLQPIGDRFMFVTSSFCRLAGRLCVQRMYGLREGTRLSPLPAGPQALYCRQ